MVNTINITYHAYAYFRLSNDDGDLNAHGKAESNSITNQRSLIHNFLKHQSDIVLVGEKVDDGYSGVNFDRPAFQQMLEDIKIEKINCIIVKDLSRFGRNYIEVGRFIQKIFPFFGVRFISINDHYDSKTASSMESHLMLPFKNLINDSYSKDLSVKIRSSLQMKMRAGDFVGAFTVYGYRKAFNNKNRLVIDEYAGSIVGDIFHWKIQGLSDSKIAKKLNELGVLSPLEYKKALGIKYNSGFLTGAKAVWSSGAIRRILTNETYLGNLVQGKTTTLNHKTNKIIAKKAPEWVVSHAVHEPLISPFKFNLVKTMMLRDTRISPSSGNLHLFSGLVFCGDCQGSMVRKRVKKKYVYQICATNKLDSKRCSNHRISELQIEEAVLAIINSFLYHVSDQQGIRTRFNDQPTSRCFAKRLELHQDSVIATLDQYRQLNMGLSQDLSDEVINSTEFGELSNYYQLQIEDCQNQINAIQREQKIIAGRHVKQRWQEILLEGQKLTSIDREMLIYFVERIDIYEDMRIKITPHFRLGDQYGD